MVAEGVEYLSRQRALPERLVAVQELHQHGEEDLALRDLRERGGGGARDTANDQAEVNQGCSVCSRCSE